MNAARLSIALSLGLLGYIWHASSLADAALNGQVKAVAEAYLKARIADIPGKASVVVAKPSRSSRLAACTGSRRFNWKAPKNWVTPVWACGVWHRQTGRSTCLHASAWSPNTSPQPPACAPARRLGAGDFVVKTGDISNFPGDIALTASQALDHTLIFGVLAGTPLRMGMLRNPWWCNKASQCGCCLTATASRSAPRLLHWQTQPTANW